MRGNIGKTKGTVEDVAQAMSDAKQARETVNRHIRADVLDHPDGSVTNSKIADGNISSSKLMNGSVVTEKIKDGSVTSEKLDSGVLKSIQQKADKQNESGGFTAGEGASSTGSDGGVAIGKNAAVVNRGTGNKGAALGEGASTGAGGSVGSYASSDRGFGGGDGANAGNGAAVGQGAKTTDGFAGGKNARCTADGIHFLDNIQLGTGDNPNEHTMQVYDYQLLDSKGKIPEGRLPHIEFDESEGGLAIGEGSQVVSGYGIAIGKNATVHDGIAIGRGATVGYDAGGSITPDGDAIQIGKGNNPNGHTLQIYNYQLLDSKGKIPIERLPSEIADIEEFDPSELYAIIYGTTTAITKIEITGTISVPSYGTFKEEIDQSFNLPNDAVGNQFRVVNSSVVFSEVYDAHGDDIQTTLDSYLNTSKVFETDSDGHFRVTGEVIATGGDRLASAVLIDYTVVYELEYTTNKSQLTTSNKSGLIPAVNELADTKADKQTDVGGFIAGEGASSTGNDGGIAIGKGASVINSGAGNKGAALGEGATAGSGGSVGSHANTNRGGAVGDGALSTGGGAVGSNTKTTDGFAGGKDARCTADGVHFLDNIQLGTGDNPNEKTLQVYSYQLLDADGKIPVERLLADMTVDTSLTVGTRPVDEEIGEYSFSTGNYNVASGKGSAVVGGGSNTASGDGAVVIGGSGNRAGVECSGVFVGASNIAGGYHSVVLGGSANTAQGDNSALIGGCGNTALTSQVKTGHYSTDGTEGDYTGRTGDAFIIGNGTGDTSRSNAFRVAYDGSVYGRSAFNSTGADYAEYFEWSDGNPSNEDRRGLFVALDGDRVRLAQSSDEVIGVISANPSVIGNSYDDTWQGMYQTDVFGQPLSHTVHHEAEYKEVEIPDVDKDGNVLKTTHTERILLHKEYDAEEYIINPDYDPEQEYIPRSQRKEWAVIGMFGQLVVTDDGTCQVNGYCTAGENGTATAAETGYRVLKRLDGNHIKILFR